VGNPSRLEKIMSDRRLAPLPFGSELPGSKIFAESIRQHNGEFVLAYTGGRVIELLDKIEESGLKIIMGPDEMDMGHMAEAYFRRTRTPLHLIVTSGVGVKAALPVVNALYDSNGFILTVGQVSYSELEMDIELFQGAKIVEPFAHWAKWAYRIPSADMIQRALKTAYFAIANGRTGPVVFELSSDVAQKEKAVFKPLEEVPLIELEAKKPKVYSVVDIKFGNLDEVIQSWSTAKRPVLMFGGGVYHSRAIPEALKLAERADTPYAQTLMVKGAMNSDKGLGASNLQRITLLNMDLAGMHGETATQLAIHSSDFLLGVGQRWDDRITLDAERFAPYAKMMWIEENNPGIREAIARRLVKIEMNPKKALEYLVENIPILNHDEWVSQILRWRKEYPMPKHVQRMVIEQLRELTRKYEPKEPVITTGVGVHQMMVAQYWDFVSNGKPNLITAGSIAPMGVGVPYGIGVLLADPSDPVYVLNGDGSAVMDQRSLIMAYLFRKKLKEHHNGLKQVIFRDNTLGMVRHWQNEMWQERRVASDLTDMIPPKYFRGMAYQNHFKYFRVDYRKEDSPKNFGVLEEFVKYRGNAILEVRMLPVPIEPMIPGNKYVGESLLPGGMKVDPADLLVGAK